ncbi:hypothetical protein M0804_002821 [Polistes exclamans]|nr:hypothetical protein M0804_002821 [Polistes exclamans]
MQELNSHKLPRQEAAASKPVNAKMTRQANFSRRLVLIVALLIACLTIVQSTKANEEKKEKEEEKKDVFGRRERRHLGGVVKVSSDREQLINNTLDVRVFNNNNNNKSPSSKSNEISSESGRKVSHRLMGGHLRDDRGKKRKDEKLLVEDMLGSSAGNGKETKNSRGDDEDEKKTLSQQVKEGKYGLIQNEIYDDDKPRRPPGIISYLDNPEVPKDTIENLGGLDEDEIWFAENHVLVLKGGNFVARGQTNRGRPIIQSEDKDKENWKPIDNYQAPRRQVKIPDKPKVPPPFPVQLKDGGPIQIIGINGSKEIENATLDRTMDPFYGKGVLPGGDGPFFTVTSNGTIVVPDFHYSDNSTNEDVQGPSNVPDDKSEEPPVFYHAIPPGAVFVPPPSNRTDYDDEDQSIYYPPPYSFYYPQDNTTAVPPGPLVPGIILPPPPDFFSPLEEKKTTTTKKYTKRPNTSMLPKSRPTYLPPRKLTTRKQWESTTTTAVPKISTTQLPRTRTYLPTMLKNLTGKSVTRIRPSTIPYVEVTTNKPSAQRNTKYYTNNPLIENRMTETNTENNIQTWSRSTNGKSIPIVTYFATTTPSSIEESVEVTPASIKNVITTVQPGQQLPNRASYYFYEESDDGNVASTVESAPVYYQTTTESPYYKVEPLSQQPREEKPYYSIETNPPKDTSRDYNVKLIDTLVDNPQVYQYRGSEDSSTSTKYDSTLNRGQNEQMLGDRGQIYYQTITSRPPVTLQRSYYTTPTSPTYYKESEERIEIDNRQNTKSKPIYQYSFEIADYSKRGQNQRPYYTQQNEEVTYDYQTVKSNNHRYDYDTDQRDTERKNNLPYKIQSPIYPSTTGRPIINVTPNPQHAYFTRQDERLLDDVTKEYFTIFGKKINEKDTPSTTPIYNKASQVTEKPDYEVNTYVSNNYNVPPEPIYTDPIYYDQEVQPPPPNLASDTRVNYRRPLPPINPDSELVEVFDPKQRGQPRQRLQQQPQRLQQQQQEQQQQQQQRLQQPSIPLHSDILVNYRNPRPPINPDAEFINPISISNQGSVNSDKSSAYFAYRFPGDGGHFYFLTPQAIRQEQTREDIGDDDDDDGGGGGGYYYPKPRGPKFLRRRRNPGNS